MKEIMRNIFAAIFYSVMGVIAISLFITAFINALVLQVVYGNVPAAFSHYFGALLALIAATFVVMRAERFLGLLAKSGFVDELLAK
ncbi:MAG TPA: hypothetical protein VFF13_01780 [archaeon]|nr:hypothetical protein [archaeon]